MKENLVQKFREFYFALPKDEQTALWDILTALRGEDGITSYSLKALTTARVRGALFGKSEKSFANRGLVFASHKKALSYLVEVGFLKEPKDLMEVWKKADAHFKRHIESATKALRKHGFKNTISDLKRFI